MSRFFKPWAKTAPVAETAPAPVAETAPAPVAETVAVPKIFSGEYNNEAVTFAIYEAAKAGQCSALDRLIKQWGQNEMFSGAINSPHKMDGTTPLMTACAGGYVDCVEKLLTAKADPNKIDDFGRTALYWAAMNGKSECIPMLLAEGADKNLATTYYKQCDPNSDGPIMTGEECKATVIRGPVGVTPLQIAIEKFDQTKRPEYEKVIQLLQSAQGSGGVLSYLNPASYVPKFWNNGGKSKRRHRKKSKKTKKRSSKKHSTKKHKK